MQASAFSLYDAANTGNAHERIGNKPCCNATERAGYDELENCRRDPWMKQEADADEHGWMNDVDRVSAAIEPRPEC